VGGPRARVRRLLRVVLLLTPAALGVAAGCRRGEAPPPNLLFVLIDALRADHVSSYGYSRPTTPSLDALAARGVRFADVMAPSNRTRTSMPSIWTGLLPSRHGLFTNYDTLEDRFVTVAELLRQRGYRTAAWCPNPSLNRRFGMGQGFEVYDDEILEPGTGPRTWERYETASRVNARALQWIDREPGRPFLAWLHYRDVHGPYLPPPGYDRLFVPGEARPLSPEEVSRRPAYLTLPDDGNDLEHYVAQYDGEIRYADDRLAELLAELDRRGLLRHTVVIVTADHGEAFLDHGQWEHGALLHGEETQVPLVIWRQGLEPRVVQRMVSTIDLFPTLLELAGVTPPPSDGESLLPLLEGRDGAYRRTQAVAESAMPGGLQRAVRADGWKLIVPPRGRPPELFHRRLDPAERIDLAAVRSRRERELAGALESILGPAASHPFRPVSEPLGRELREQLRALGYAR